ncbi:antibiotic biosynthesis monooxygenase [Pseudomonas sp. P115]|uniref:putative quinol monooxygenase n=1 Tax=Pseudomonas pisciculturae TaxID=2730413 RepID=UPI001359F0C7|nr:antibiotic biosynthesis monooxygenase [Pseudomonas pisciculturae]MBF6031193.1 antibiotic biosynthesis monooxygenase [Pseudomonas pisciculturae]
MPACAFNTVNVRAVAGRSAQLGKRLQQIADTVRTAPGCLGYVVQRSPIDANLWTVIGQWACAEQLNAHFELPALQRFIELTEEQLACRLDFHH